MQAKIASENCKRKLQAKIANHPVSETKSNKSLLEKMNRNQPMTQPSAGNKGIQTPLSNPPGAQDITEMT